MKLMCRQFGGFDPKVIESGATSTLPFDADWSPILEASAITVMPEVTARAVSPRDIAVVPIQPPPELMLALAWRCGQVPPKLTRFLDFVRGYRDQHDWVAAPVPEVTLPAPALARARSL